MLSNKSSLHLYSLREDPGDVKTISRDSFNCITSYCSKNQRSTPMYSLMYVVM